MYIFIIKLIYKTIGCFHYKTKLKAERIDEVDEKRGKKKKLPLARGQGVDTKSLSIL